MYCRLLQQQQLLVETKGSPAATAVAAVGVDREKKTATCVVDRAIGRGRETGAAVVGRTGRGRGAGVAVIGGVGRGKEIGAAVVGGAGRGRTTGAVVVGETSRGRGAGVGDCTGTSRGDGVTGASKGRGIPYERPRMVGMGVLHTESGFKVLNPEMPMNSTIITENLGHHKPTSGVK
ncbi:spidroin-1-like [Capsicum annuum]|uniref:spidroin-1-like n=1 Tax=Capsicum annuum TaxID=4072 RepID=UPI0007BEFE45|nr:spidroin-1-like [Capsicum annuum]